MAPKYAIGIDLGTTHSALSAEALADATAAPDGVLPVPQLTGPGAIEAKPLLPSFLYLPHAAEFADGDLTLPWGDSRARIVGELARERGGQTPIRLVSSAKSWLCHGGVDRRAAILPMGAPDDVPKVSPLEASMQYIAHLAAAWNLAHPEAPFAEQEITLTVPASFDPAARELTAEALSKAGAVNATLLEEPQAALYSWIARTGDAWREHLSVGDVVLVVDVGGGTTDFSLMVIEEDAGALSPRRIAVGEHILLGGDNMDLTLAYVVRAKLEAEGKSLDDWQMRALTLACRGAKEQLFAGGDVESVPLVIPSRGSSLIGGAIRTEVTLYEATRSLLEGFFPDVSVTDEPARAQRTGLLEFGLPYAQDAAVTRHLGAFLRRHAAALGADAPAKTFLAPNAVLFNGGVFKSPELANRIVHTLNGWLTKDALPAVRVLPGAELDLACARGAAYYGRVGHTGGVRIRGGSAQSFYLGVELAQPAVPGMAAPIHALCIAPFGMEEGTPAQMLPDTFGLVVGESVRFRFFGSSTRRDDTFGARLSSWSKDELSELPSLEVTLPTEGRAAGDVVPVHFRARVSEVGTLDLTAVAQAGGQSWKIAFDLRSPGAR